MAEIEEMDTILGIRVSQEPDVEKTVDELHDVLKEACRSSFQTPRVHNMNSARKTVPWWSEELTMMRKRLNALRRRYQRTQDNEDLRTQRWNQYSAYKTNYVTKIRKAKNL